MEGVKILHTGDFHIGSSRSGVSSGRAELKNTFIKVIEICKAENIDFLLISGDLFDTPFPDSETAGEIIDAMSQIPETVIAISPGNHDYVCPDSVWIKNQFPDNVIVFTSFMEYYDFEEKNVRLFGAAFTDRFEKIPLLTNNIPVSENMINLCVLHGQVVSALGESEYNPVSVDTVAKSGIDYLAMGHIHKRSDIQKSGATFYSYCGCPDGRGFDEDGSRGVYVGCIEKGRCNLEYTELSSRKYVIDNLDVSGCKTTNQVSSKILSHIKEKYSDSYKNNLYRIFLCGTVTTDFIPDIARIEDSLKDDTCYIRVYDNTEVDIENILHLASESSFRGIFVQKLLEMQSNAHDVDKELYLKALRLGLKAFEREVTLGDN